MRLASVLFLSLSLHAADPILRQRFTSGTEGWIALGPGTLAAADGVLVYNYQAGAAERAIAAMPAAGVSFTEMKSLRFEVKTDSAFAVALILSEKKPAGGNYSAVAWSAGATWQPVVLTPRDFTLSEGPTDPVDTDGKLDLDQIENVAIVDLSQFLSTLTRDSQIYSPPHTGLHTISIRNFEVLREAPASGPHPQIEWVGLGGTTLEQAEGILTIHYRQMADLWTAFTRIGPPPGTSAATHLALDIQSARDAQLAISIKDATARHNIDFYVPAGAKLVHREVELTAFDSPVDPATIRSITILDVTSDPGQNQLSIQNLTLK